MYVFWTHIVSDGMTQRGKSRTKTSKSSVHLADQYTTLRTACNMKIPVGVEQQRTADVNSLPKDRPHCKTCFK